MRKRNLILVFLFMMVFLSCTTSQKRQQGQQKSSISKEVLHYLEEQGIDINKPVEPMLATHKTNTEVNVDCAASLGDFLHVERYNNFENSREFVEQRDADVKFYNKQGLHGNIYRVWFIGNNYYYESTGDVDISQMSDYLSDASKISDYLLVNCSHLGVVRGWEIKENEKIDRLAKILKELKVNFPKIKYIEASNEPDYANEGVTPQNYYSYYKIYYKAVNKVNAELKAEIPLLIGGPAISQFSLEWFKPFLDDFVKDPSSDKRIDFISYHGYYTKPDSAYLLFKDNPSLVKDQRAILNKELVKRNISIDIPVFITEMGIYPGPAFDDYVTMKNDHLRQATGMASLFYWYMDCNNIYPFNWVIRHRKEGRKDQLVTRKENGELNIQTEKFTPYGNMLLMMSKMKKNRISSISSTAIDQGKGLYSLAAQDSSGISIMVWNYQSRNTEGYKVEIKVSNLPESWKQKELSAKIYRIDRETSNYHADIDNSNLQMVEDNTIIIWEEYNNSVFLEPNTLQLIVLESID